MKWIKFILARLSEPSTMAGIAVLATMAGIPPGTVEAVSHVVISGCALAAILLPEK